MRRAHPQVAVRSHELAWHIVKSHRDPTTWRDLDRNGVHDEVDEVRDTLWQHARTIYGAFDFYAALYSDGQAVPGEPDVFNLPMNAYMALVKRCRMTSRACPHGEFETIWAIVNASDRVTAGEETLNSRQTLNRQEFLQCLVRTCAASPPTPC